MLCCAALCCSVLLCTVLFCAGAATLSQKPDTSSLHLFPFPAPVFGTVCAIYTFRGSFEDLSRTLSGSDCCSPDGGGWPRVRR